MNRNNITLRISNFHTWYSEVVTSTTSHIGVEISFANEVSFICKQLITILYALHRRTTDITIFPFGYCIKEISSYVCKTATAFYILHLVISCITICHKISIKTFQKFFCNISAARWCIFIQNYRWCIIFAASKQPHIWFCRRASRLSSFKTCIWLSSAIANPLLNSSLW